MRGLFQEDVVALARSWIGTPYCHGAACRGAGADCLGLVRGVWRELYGRDAAPVPPYGTDWAESGQERLLADALSWHFRRVSAGEEALGQVLLFRLRRTGPAKHLGIQSAGGAEPAFVHAFHGAGVVESALTAPWWSRLAGRYAFPAA